MRIKEEYNFNQFDIKTYTYKFSWRFVAKPEWQTKLFNVTSPLSDEKLESKMLGIVLNSAYDLDLYTARSNVLVGEVEVVPYNERTILALLGTECSWERIGDHG